MASPPALIAGERRLLELLEMVARGCPLPEVLDALCSLVEDSTGDCRCSVLLVHPDSSHLQHGAAPSLSPRLVEAIHGRPLTPYWGPCAMAVHQRTQVIVADLADDARWAAEWCGLALDLGLRSCWTTPILSLAGKALGTFAIYRHEPGSPTPLLQGLIEQFTHIASIAIERAQNETALRLAEEALGKVRSELAHVARVATVGALTASIAHEVNQPLSGMLANASTCLRMLADDPPDLEGARETLRRTLRDGNRAAAVIGRLRALFTKQETAAEAVDLNEATREVLALSWSEVQHGRVTVRTNLAADLPLVYGDRVQLQQVVLNLLLNALEAMVGVEDRPRLLAIRTEREAGDRVRLSVQDSGAGFDPQNLERLFDAFYSTKAGGMGIGLSISRSIVESHQGRLSAALNDGPGATFSFSIPRNPGRIAAVHGGDDDVSVRETLESLIRWAGWRPETFPSAQEAAELRALRERYASLTRREREVMALVVAGLLNKQIGAELGTSEVTVKAHRGKMMRKMQAGSLADLVRAAAKLDLPLPAKPLETDTLVQ